MASNDGSGPKDYLQDILDKGSQGNPGGDKWQEFLKNRDGITGPNEPVSEKTGPDQEKEPQQQELSFQQNEPEKDEPEKD
jgi:hypothetical protein